MQSIPKVVWRYKKTAPPVLAPTRVKITVQIAYREGAERVGQVVLGVVLLLHCCTVPLAGAELLWAELLVAELRPHGVDERGKLGELVHVLEVDQVQVEGMGQDGLQQQQDRHRHNPNHSLL